MAKGDPSTIFVPESFLGDNKDTDAVVAWLNRQFMNISLSFELEKQYDVLNVAPAKPRDGLTAFADGTNWNPGSGKGFYGYYNGAWHFLG